MKTIKSIKQLRAEKKRVKKHQQELEIKLQHNWNELKESLKPSGVAAATFDLVLKNNTAKKSAGNNLLKTVFNFGAGLLASKLADKASEKIGHILHKKQTA